MLVVSISAWKEPQVLQHANLECTWRGIVPWAFSEAGDDSCLNWIYEPDLAQMDEKNMHKSLIC